MKNTQIAIFLLTLAGMTARADSGADWKKLEEDGKKEMKRNDFIRAEKLFLQAAGMAEGFGKDDERYEESLRQLGYAAMQIQDFNNADFAYTRLGRIDGARRGTNDLVVANDLMALAEVSGYTGQFKRGHESIDAATAIINKKGGAYSLEMGLCLATRAHLELEEEHFAAAETNFQKALEIFDSKGIMLHFSGPEMQMKETGFQANPIFLANILNDYSICQTREGKFAGAEASLHRAIGIIEHEYGKASLRLINSFYNLGQTYAAEKKYAEAEKELHSAMALLRKVDPANPMIRRTEDLLAEVLTAEGKTHEASLYKSE